MPRPRKWLFQPWAFEALMDKAIGTHLLLSSLAFGTGRAVVPDLAVRILSGRPGGRDGGHDYDVDFFSE
jgi:hypothetical protein